MRTNLTLDDIGGLSTSRSSRSWRRSVPDGSVLLSPVWHEWRDGGFNLWLPADDVKTRHLRRDPRATIVVAESVRPAARRGTPHGGPAPARGRSRRCHPHRDPVRGSGEGDEYVREAGYDSVIGRLEPGHLRIWDFADE